jgi:ATP-dependent Zn protease
VSSNIKTAILWVVLICLAVLLYTIVRQGKHPTEDQITFSAFVDQVKDKKVKDVTIANNEVHGTYVGSDKGLRTLIPTN